MREPIENEYFNWLCAKVVDIDNPNYFKLLEILHRTEFVWVVSGDRHRMEDGIELRQDFLRETHSYRDRLWEALPCSVLELLIAFAKRASFLTDLSVRYWFWEFMTNLNLERFRRVFDSDVPEIEDILFTFIWRQYDSRGYGGLFPMSRTKKDQRQIEIWYQFSEYVTEEQELI